MTRHGAAGQAPRCMNDRCDLTAVPQNGIRTAPSRRTDQSELRHKHASAEVQKMTRNKQQALRLDKTARTSIALALSLSMVLGLVPNGALQAWAEEAELQDAVAIEETYEDPAADELQEESAEPVEEPAAPQEGPVEPHEDPAEPGDTLLEADADGMHAQLAVKAGVELPEGSRLVVTPLVGTSVEGAAETSSRRDEQPVNGSDIVLGGMAAAVNEAEVQKGEQNTDESGNVTVPTVVAAYAVEVVDGENRAVAIDDEQATLTATLSQDVMNNADGVYSVTRNPGNDASETEPIDPTGTPVATIVQKEYEYEQASAEAVAFSGEAVDVTNLVEVDEESGSAKLVVAGVRSLAVTAAGPLKAVGPKPAARETLDTNALGFTVNLFDYTTIDELKNTYDKDTEDPRNANYASTHNGINKGRNKTDDLKFYGSGDGKVSSVGQYHNGNNPGNGINQFTGAGNNQSGGGNFYRLQIANQGIVKRELSGDASTPYEDRYPIVNTSAAHSTDYLFNTTDIDGAKKVYKDVNHLFYTVQPGDPSAPAAYRDSLNEYGELFVYDSNYSYAYYPNWQESGEGRHGGDFTVYNGTFDRAGGSGSGMKVGFFPFDDWRSGYEPCINPNETRNNQTTDLTREYWNWDPSNPGVYPNNNVKHLNHHLGLTMTVPLTMPLDGKIPDDDTDPSNDKPMVFEFSGDDDMWVFVDGKLVLDIGGIHQPVKGSINFATGVVQLDHGTANIPNDDGNPKQQVDQRGHFSYAANGIADKNVLGDTAYLWDEAVPAGSGKTSILGSKYSRTNCVGSEHTLQVFYLERGGCDSNLKIMSNIHLMTRKSVEVNKVWADGQAHADANGKVKVQLIREALRQGTNEVVGRAAVGAPVDLSSTSSPAWHHEWTDLPSVGYNATNSIQGDRVTPDDVYCDYHYYVQEVLDDSVASQPLYSSSENANLETVEITYKDAGNADQTGKAVEVIGASANISPVKITNVPTNIEVVKQWNDKYGRDETASSIHDNDSVWVQLYKQTRASAEAQWSDDIAVGDPVELKKSNDSQANWRHVFPITETGDNVRYLVREGVKEGTKFVPSVVVPAANRQYEWMSTTYTPKSARNKDDGSGVEWTEGSDTQDYLVVPDSGSGKALIVNKATVDVTIKKIDAQDSHALAGAKFKVYRDGGAEGADGKYVKDDDYKDEQLFSQDEYTTAGEQGVVTVSDLTVGTYWIVETVAPDGYLVMGPDNPIGVKVATDGTVTLVDKNGDPIASPDPATQPSISTQGDTITLTVPNARTYSLPAAGGPGAYPFLLAGSFIAALVFDRSGELRRKMASLTRQGARS